MLDGVDAWSDRMLSCVCVCVYEQTTAVEESSAAVRELFYETLNNLREEEKKIKAEAWMFEGERHR